MVNSDVIVVNEWTLRRSDGSGSRGSTPGDYLTRYMGRENATEFIAPARMDDMESFITRYMARKDAIDEALDVSSYDMEYQPRTSRGNKRGGKNSSKDTSTTGASDDGDQSITISQLSPTTHRDLLASLTAHMKFAGVAFGNDDVSMSHETFVERSKWMQDQFDAGKTVLKTVVSFDQDYLKEMRVVDDDFIFQKAGDYRGKIDQLKLRTALMAGCARMSGHFDNLQYVGVIQVDTAHVHCHFAMVDAGHGRIANDGRQRGKVPFKVYKSFKRAVDNDLQRQMGRTPLAAAASYERQGVGLSMRKWAYEVMLREADAQFLYSVLPEDKQLWRADVDDSSMDRAHAIVHDMVTSRLQDSESGYSRAIEALHAYVDNRAEREDMDVTEQQALFERGRKRLDDAAVNGVYQVLRAVPETQLRPASEYMELMGVDMDSLQAAGLDVGVGDGAGSDIEVGTGGTRNDEQSLKRMQVRVRSYAARKAHHEQQAEHYGEQALAWERAYSAGKANEDSRVMHEFYTSEAQYHQMAAAKYAHFVPPAVAVQKLREQWEDIAEYGYKLTGVKAMRGDASILRSDDPQEAEDLGQQLYGVSGGRHICRGIDDPRMGRVTLDQRIARMEQTYKNLVDDFARQVRAQGAQLRVDLKQCRSLVRDHERADDDFGDMMPVPGMMLVPGVGSTSETEPAQELNVEVDTHSDTARFGDTSVIDDAGYEGYSVSDPSRDVEYDGDVRPADDAQYDPSLYELDAEVDPVKMYQDGANATSIHLDVDIDPAEVRPHTQSFYDEEAYRHAFAMIHDENADEQEYLASPGAALYVDTSPEYSFEDCRMVDMHDVGADWLEDTPVGKEVQYKYAELAARRRTRLRAARAWLHDTGQFAAVQQQTGMAQADILRMEATSQRLQETGTLAGARTQMAQGGHGEKDTGASVTYPLDTQVQQHVERAIDDSVVKALQEQLREPQAGRGGDRGGRTSTNGGDFGG